MKMRCYFCGRFMSPHHACAFIVPEQWNRATALDPAEPTTAHLSCARKHGAIKPPDRSEQPPPRG